MSGPPTAFARPAGGARDRLSRWTAARLGIAPVETPPAGGERELRPPRRRTVVVVGGGLAGMAAALTLAERGYAVRLVEREKTLGGRVGAWPHMLDEGEETIVEHGFHGFFLQYYNLFGLMERAGIGAADFPLIDDYEILAADGRREGLRRYPPAPPLSALAMALRSPFLHLGEARRTAGFARLRDAFLRFDATETAERYERLSFAALLRELGLEGTGFEMVFKVFGHSFFSDAESVSAAEIVKNFHFFFFANPEGLLFRFCATDVRAALWTPLQRRLESLGGSVELGREIAELLPSDAGAGFAVRCGRDGGADTPADAVVLALDPVGLRRVLSRSLRLRDVHPVLEDALDAVPEPQPYAVLRLWIDRDCAPWRPAFTSLHGFAPLDSISLYHRMQRASAAWVGRHGGAVLELHSYTPGRAQAADPERLERALVARAVAAFPELAGMRVRHGYRQVRCDFPSFAPGSAHRRLGTRTGVPGLLLAGDSVRLPIPAALMEAAVASGILAANEIAAADGVRGASLWSVPLRGALARGGAR